MKGHVRKRGSKWSFVIDVGRDPATGKRKQKWFSGFATKRDAERAMAEKIAEISRGEYIEPTKMTVGEFFNMWLQEEAKPNRSAATYDLYSSMTRTHIVPGLGNIPLSNLTPLHIHRFVNSLSQKGITAPTIKVIIRIMKVALKWSVKMQLIPKNPAENISGFIEQQAKIRVWTQEQVNHFLKVARRYQLFPAFYLAITTGMRMGELLGLKWEDVDLERGVISVRRILQRTSNGLELVEKTKSQCGRRSVSISPSTVEVLRKHRIKQKEHMLKYNYRNNDLVFTTRTGKPVEPRNLREYFRVIVEKAGLPRIRFHDLRHTHATLLLQQGVHPKIVSERLGHSTISITLDTYSHVIPSMQKEAAQMFDQILDSETR